VHFQILPYVEGNTSIYRCAGDPTAETATVVTSYMENSSLFKATNPLKIVQIASGTSNVLAFGPIYRNCNGNLVKWQHGISDTSYGPAIGSFATTITNPVLFQVPTTQCLRTNFVTPFPVALFAFGDGSVRGFGPGGVTTTFMNQIMDPMNSQVITFPN
jgi:hypothetical protein